jgi:hypothetical protein
MPRENYPYIDVEASATFFFFSEGVKGKVPKVVLFTPKEGQTWSLAFGDLTPNGVDVKVISGNLDWVKVMNTVIAVVEQFTEAYPERLVYFKPVDEKRKVLFNWIIQSRKAELENLYLLFGIKEDKEEQYQTGKTYDAFVLRRKKVTFKSKS